MPEWFKQYLDSLPQDKLAELTMWLLEQAKQKGILERCLAVEEPERR